SFGPCSAGAPARSATWAVSPRQNPGRITRSTSAGGSRWRATQSVVSSAATEIGSTATTGSNPARGARSARTRRSAGSANRPVTNNNRGRAASGDGGTIGLPVKTADGQHAATASGAEQVIEKD